MDPAAAANKYQPDASPKPPRCSQKKKARAIAATTPAKTSTTSTATANRDGGLSSGVVGRGRPLSEHLKEHALLLLTFLGVVIGVLLGFLLRPMNLTSESIMLIAFPGDLLMRMLKMLILPLIASSLITGVAVLDPKSSGKIGLYSVIYYIITTLLAAILGIILVVSIKPGDKETKAGVGEGTAQSTTTTQDAIMDLIRNLFPENLVQATIQQGQSHYTYESSKLIKSSKCHTHTHTHTCQSIQV